MPDTVFDVRNFIYTLCTFVDRAQMTQPANKQFTEYVSHIIHRLLLRPSAKNPNFLTPDQYYMVSEYIIKCLSTRTHISPIKNVLNTRITISSIHYERFVNTLNKVISNILLQQDDTYIIYKYQLNIKNMISSVLSSGVYSLLGSNNVFKQLCHREPLLRYDEKYIFSTIYISNIIVKMKTEDIVCFFDILLNKIKVSILVQEGSDNNIFIKDNVLYVFNSDYDERYLIIFGEVNHSINNYDISTIDLPFYHVDNANENRIYIVRETLDDTMSKKGMTSKLLYMLIDTLISNNIQYTTNDNLFKTIVYSRNRDVIAEHLCLGNVKIDHDVDYKLHPSLFIHNTDDVHSLFRILYINRLGMLKNGISFVHIDPLLRLQPLDIQTRFRTDEETILIYDTHHDNPDNPFYGFTDIYITTILKYTELGINNHSNQMNIIKTTIGEVDVMQYYDYIDKMTKEKNIFYFRCLNIDNILENVIPNLKDYGDLRLMFYGPSSFAFYINDNIITSFIVSVPVDSMGGTKHKSLTFNKKEGLLLYSLLTNNSKYKHDGIYIPENNCTMDELIKILGHEPIPTPSATVQYILNSSNATMRILPYTENPDNRSLYQGVIIVTVSQSKNVKPILDWSGTFSLFIPFGNISVRSSKFLYENIFALGYLHAIPVISHITSCIKIKYLNDNNKLPVV